MLRLMSVATRSGCSRATSRAGWPTTAMLSSVSRTALGVSISPSRLGRVLGWPWSSRVAIAEKVVPRSIPTSLPVAGAMWSTLLRNGLGQGVKASRMPYCSLPGAPTEEKAGRPCPRRPGLRHFVLPLAALQVQCNAASAQTREHCMAGGSRSPLFRLDARRIALIKPSALGDIVHSLPVLSALRRRFPQAHITYVVHRAYEPILHGHPHLDATLAFDRTAVRRGLWGRLPAFLGFLALLRRQRFALVLHLP